ncbi:MAG: hypothetical protein EZS28_044624 [Streblomastix strix]|uniref:Uncharacterized protein n=1 Tax=Streblomastix strix TaxID=222440 RepID=A0A5J4TNE6_9EUKA|nr:MAG: hypothetical protein EZS28_044624 [Streblomastix strix]
MNTGRGRRFARGYDFQLLKVVPFVFDFQNNQPFYSWPQRVEYANPTMFYPQQFATPQIREHRDNGNPSPCFKEGMNPYES